MNQRPSKKMSPQDNPFRIYPTHLPKEGKRRSVGGKKSATSRSVGKKRGAGHTSSRKTGRKALSLHTWRHMLILSAVAALLMFVLPWRELISAALPPLRQAPSITLPVNYDYISSPFGKRWGRQHQGIDFAADAGTPIRASSEGQVVYSGWEPGYGKTVLIEHGNGLQTRYAHCSSLLVTAGREVKKGSIIARVGSTGHSTGPHLHFEVLVRGVRKNPAWYYKFEPMDLEGKTDSFALLIQKTVFQVQRRLEMLLAKLYFPA